MSAPQAYQAQPVHDHDGTRTPSEELPEKKITDSEASPSIPTLEQPMSSDDKQYGVPKPEEQDRGVSRIEALYLVFGNGGINIWALYLSIAIISYALALSSNTVSHWLGFATSSFGKHSLLGAVEVATTIVSGVAKPFIAKVADITSRPIAYAVSLVFYVVGFIIVACSSGVGAVAGGEILYTIGFTGLDLVTDILVADISPLEWRGFATALVSSPYIINAFVAGFITDGLGVDGWRWGYGMFCIILPASMAPALMVLFYADIKAKKMNALSIAASSYSARIAPEIRKSWWRQLVYYLDIIDAFGLLLLGVAWALLLLPMTLYKTAEKGWANPSLIAMLVVGAVLLVAFGVYEKSYARYPLQPMRVLNKTFVCCVIIDFFYFVSGNMRSLYYSSWVWVVKDWSLRDWTFYTNTLTVGLCVFGLLAGLIQRYTHRYKFLQILGLCIRALGMGITLHARGPNATDGELVMTQILVALGGAFSVVGSRVASQASVPHQDLATVIALLSLWTKLGGAIGYAIAAAVWTGRMPGNLNKHLNGYASAAEIKKIFGSIKTARNTAPEVRTRVIFAYNDTVKLLYIPALVLSFVPIAAGLMTSNFYLGKQHNAVELKVLGKELMEDESAVVREPTLEGKGWLYKMTHWKM